MRSGASAAECSSRMPAASRTISAIGQYVIPSPYGRQRPVRTRTSPCAAAHQLRGQARLADAGLADDGRERRAGRAAPRRAARRSSASSAARPTIGVSRRRALRRVRPLRTSVSRYAGSGSDLPLSASGSTGSAETAPRTRRKVGSPSRISPAGAACSRRAATLTASPVTRAWRGASPATTSPVLTPIRSAIDGRSAARAPRSAAASAPAYSSAARTARSASSSCATGTPNTATTASPMNFSTVPPWRSIARPHLVEVRSMISRTALGVDALAHRGRAGQSQNSMRRELPPLGRLGWSGVAAASRRSVPRLGFRAARHPGIAAIGPISRDRRLRCRPRMHGTAMMRAMGGENSARRAGWTPGFGSRLDERSLAPAAPRLPVGDEHGPRDGGCDRAARRDLVLGPTLPLFLLVSLRSACASPHALGQMAKHVPIGGRLVRVCRARARAEDGVPGRLGYAPRDPGGGSCSSCLSLAFVVQDVTVESGARARLGASPWWLWVASRRGRSCFVLAYRGIRLAMTAAIALGAIELVLFAALGRLDRLLERGTRTPWRSSTRGIARRGRSRLVLQGPRARVLVYVGLRGCGTLAEEAREPAPDVPRAIVGSTLAIGLFVVFCAYATVVGFGFDGFADAALSSGNPGLSSAPPLGRGLDSHLLRRRQLTARLGNAVLNAVEPDRVRTRPERRAPARLRVDALRSITRRMSRSSRSCSSGSPRPSLRAGSGICSPPSGWPPSRSPWSDADLHLGVRVDLPLLLARAARRSSASGCTRSCLCCDRGARRGRLLPIPPATAVSGGTRTG